MINPIFWPRVNYVLRHALRPFGSVLPVDWQPRVTGLITVPLDDQKSVILDCNPTSFAAKRLFFESTDGYEPETFRLLRALAPEADVILDIGANLGYYSLVCAAYNPDATIRSFEPLPGPYHFLKRNIRLNGFGHVEALPLALSSASGEETFYYTVDPTFSDLEYHLTPTGSLDRTSAQQYENARSCTVNVETVDRYVSSELEGTSVDLMKLDTESTEHLVLEGATHVLATHRPYCVCEVLPDAAHEVLHDIQQRHEYRFYRIGDRCLTEQSDLTSTDAGSRNYFMVPEERRNVLNRVERALAASR